MLEKSTVMTRLREAGVIAVLRAPSEDLAVQAVDALVAGGVTGIEITFSTPGAANAMARVREQHGENVVLGAGTILTADQARASVEAGCEFLVCPGTSPELAEVMTGTGAVTALGAMTPSEVMTATALGADIIKIFPASLGGPSYLKALKAPFPDAPLMPTGGVSSSNIADWVAAGAIAVGAGGDLCPTSAMAAGDWPEITRRAAEFRGAWVSVGGAK